MNCLKSICNLYLLLVQTHSNIVLLRHLKLLPSGCWIVEVSFTRCDQFNEWSLALNVQFEIKSDVWKTEPIYKMWSVQWIIINFKWPVWNQIWCEKNRLWILNLMCWSKQKDQFSHNPRTKATTLWVAFLTFRPVHIDL
jgi:hypothetical protein